VVFRRFQDGFVDPRRTQQAFRVRSIVESKDKLATYQTMSNSRAVLSAPEIAGDPSEYEREHVHAVYDNIASHFSSTRYKVWASRASQRSSIETTT
jgi:hypothetical protein